MKSSARFKVLVTNINAMVFFVVCFVDPNTQKTVAEDALLLLHVEAGQDARMMIFEIIHVFKSNIAGLNHVAYPTTPVLAKRLQVCHFVAFD